MFRTALFSALLVVGSSFAAETQPNTDQKTPPVPADLKAVLDRLDKIEQSIKDYSTEQNSKIALWAQMFQKDIFDLREAITRIQKDMNEFKAGRPTVETLKPTEGAGTATLRLVNAHVFLPMEVRVNGSMHTVLPGQTLPVTVPAGSVNFQVMQTDGFVRARHLGAGVIHEVTMR